jgi:hypothetical protein
MFVAKKPPSTIDEYLAGLSPEDRKALQKVRRAAHAATPEAEECISYGRRRELPRDELAIIATLFRAGTVMSSTWRAVGCRSPNQRQIPELPPRATMGMARGFRQLLSTSAASFVSASET